MLGTLTDKRTDVMGAGFTIDPEKFDAMCATAAISPLVKIDVVLINASEDAPPHGSIRAKKIVPEGVSEDDEEKVDYDYMEWSVGLPVSDRMEFSDKAVERVNRNLLHTLRHLSQVCNMASFFVDMQLINGVAALAGPVMEADAYKVERTIKEVPEARCLLPQPVALAEDPVVEVKPE
jgi:hypothetical protein